MREAIIALDDGELAELGFEDLVGVCRDAGIRVVELLEDEGRGGVAEVLLANRLPEEELDGIECLNDWEYLGTRREGYVYLLDVTMLELPEEATVDHDELVGMCDPTVDDRGLMLSLVGSQESIRRMIRHFEAAGVVPDLHKLGSYGGGRTGEDGLTDRQLEVLRTAYDLGFYEIPKQTSTEQIAAELELDPSTVSEHLQRAERNVLRQQLTA